MSLTEFQQLESYITNYSKIVSDQEDTRLYNDLLINWNNYKTYYGVLREFAGKEKFEEGLAYRNNDSNRTRRALRASIDSIPNIKLPMQEKSRKKILNFRILLQMQYIQYF